MWELHVDLTANESNYAVLLVIGRLVDSQLLTDYMMSQLVTKPKPKPRFFSESVRHRNLGFSAVIEGFLICLYIKFIQGLL